MEVPGSNLLAEALEVIEPQLITYFRNTGRTQNDVYQWVSDFDAGTEIYASVQAVKRSVYDQFGLEFQRNYVMLFVMVDAIDLDRDVSGDEFEWNGRRYRCESESDWYAMDGWTSILSVKIVE